MIPRPAEGLLEAFIADQPLKNVVAAFSTQLLARQSIMKDPRRQPRLHQLQVSAVRHGRRAAARARRRRADRQSEEPVHRGDWRPEDGAEGAACRIMRPPCGKCLEQLTDPQCGCLKDAAEVSAIGFKAVHGGRVSGVQRVTPDVLAAMEADEPGRPGTQSALHQGDATAGREVAGDSARGGVRDRLSRHDRRPATVLSDSATSGPKSCTSNAGASTARAIATSRNGRPSC